MLQPPRGATIHQSCNRRCLRESTAILNDIEMCGRHAGNFAAHKMCGAGGGAGSPRQKTLKRQPKGWFLQLPAPSSSAPHSPKSSRASSFLRSRDQHKGGVQSKQRNQRTVVENIGKNRYILKCLVKKSSSSLS